MKPNHLYTIEHVTGSRMRIRFAFPVTASVCEQIEVHLRERTHYKRLSWIPRKQALIIAGTLSEQRGVIRALETLELTQVRQAYDQPIAPRWSLYESLKDQLIYRAVYTTLVPGPIRALRTLYKSVGYLKQAIQDLVRRELTVEVLDATAILISILQGDIDSAGSIIFMLELSDHLVDQMVAKSKDDLADSLGMSVSHVWRIIDGQAVEVSTESIQVGDTVLVNTGNVVPFDGEIVKGAGYINESSLTGEPFAVYRQSGQPLYANTVVESGEIHLRVTNTQVDSQMGRLIDLIIHTENNQAETVLGYQAKAQSIVKYNYIGAGLTWLLTRSLAKATIFMMVDYSCALRLIGPMAYLAAMRDLSDRQIIVKGSKHLETYQQVDTFIFDKTGTLTVANPEVSAVFVHPNYSQVEAIRVAACLEEHYHHPVAEAIERIARAHGIDHEDETMHGELEYIVSHGIASKVAGKRVVIGSKHFVLEDEQNTVHPDLQQMIDRYEAIFNLIYLGWDGELIALFAIDNQTRPETGAVLNELHRRGKRLILLTGDQQARTDYFAHHYPFDEVICEVLPEDKYAIVEREQQAGHIVAMTGDGVNDSAALTLADIGFVMRHASDLAHQVSDIILMSDDLRDLLTLSEVSAELTDRLRRDYRSIIGVNSALIAGGILGWLPSSTAALLHNSYTVLSAALTTSPYPMTPLAEWSQRLSGQ